MPIVDGEQHSVDLFADAADLPFKGVEIDATWLGILSYGRSVQGQLWGQEGGRR